MVSCTLWLFPMFASLACNRHPNILPGFVLWMIKTTITKTNSKKEKARMVKSFWLFNYSGQPLDEKGQMFAGKMYCKRDISLTTSTEPML